MFDSIEPSEAATVIESIELYPYLVPSLERAVGSPLENVKVVQILKGNSGTLTARVTGKADGANFSVVVKSRQTECIHKALWYSEDTRLIDREYYVYQLLEELNVPHARLMASRYDSPSDWTLVLEDLAEHYIIPDDTYVLTEQDQMSIVRTYAAVHSASYKRFRNNRHQVIECLQQEEGSQVNVVTAQEMLRTLDGYSIESSSLVPQDLEKALTVLLACREQWQGKPRCLTFNDFDLGNVALPQSDEDYAILLDWELAGLSLPQFDLVNIGHGGHSPLDDMACYYLDLVAEHGVAIDIDEFRAGMAYATLSMYFYALWLLHLKLRADPEGKLPTWMTAVASGLFAGGLLRSAEEAAIFEPVPSVVGS